jgi:hypothetical protein
MSPFESFVIPVATHESGSMYAEKFTNLVNNRLAEIARGSGKVVASVMVDLATHRYEPPVTVPHLLIIAEFPEPLIQEPEI